MNAPNVEHARERLEKAYETMLKRVAEYADHAEHETLPKVKQGLDKARDMAVELGELTREEADRISDYVERDTHDAAEWLVETGQEFREWLSFDWQLVEGRLFDWFAKVADQTSVQLRNIAENAKHMDEYRTGEITGPGALVCRGCGKVMNFKKTGHIPPCPSCHGTGFKRG